MSTVAVRPRPTYGLLIAAIFALLLLLFIYSVVQVLLLLFIAVLFSLYLGAITDFLQRRLKIPRPLGLLVAVLFTVVAGIGIGAMIVPPVLEQVQELFAAIPGMVTSSEASLRAILARYPAFEGMMPEAQEASGYLSTVVGKVGSYFAGIFPYLFGGLHLLIDVFSVLVMGIYMTLHPTTYREGAVSLAPPVHRELVRSIFEELGSTLRSWIVGQLIAMAFLGFLTWIGLMFLHVPYALAFGVFTAVAAIVPFFGTLASTLLPALFVIPSMGIGHALLVVLLGTVIHLIEANFVVPVILQHQVHLPPVLSILSVLVMAELLGVIGLLVAIPVLATAMVIVRRIYIQRLLEGRGFRRTVRDSALEIHVPGTAKWVHPQAAELELTSFLEQLPRAPATAA